MMSTTNNVILAGFLQLCLAATFAVAAPVAESADTVTTTVVDNAWSYGTGGGLLGLVVLILDVIIFAEVLKSNRPPASKLIWLLVVFFFPILGALIYWLFSNRDAHNGGSGSYETLP